MQPRAFVFALLAFFSMPLCADEPPKPFELKAETRNYDVRHLKLDVRFDLKKAIVAGTCAITFAPLADAFTQFFLHSKDTIVLAVSVEPAGGAARPAKRFRTGDGLLRIDLDQPLPKDQPATVTIEYEAAPTRGLFFFAPSAAYPEIPYQVWSQGEGTDNRNWFPSYDEPDDRFSSEIIAHVPAGFVFISNGKCVQAPAPAAVAPVSYGKSSVADLPAEEAVWHYQFDAEHVNYLISAIVGRFDKVEDKWQDVPLYYYVPPGRASEARLAFGLTSDMMRFYSDYTGQKYAWPSYTQTTVWDFSYGGMENTSVTTLNLRALHDERSHLDYQADGLVAHELAHQWFGDLVTCNDWSEMWLNEGFATYFTSLWVLDHEGAEAYADDLHGTMRSVRDTSTPEFRANLKPEKDAPNKPTELPAGLNYTKGSSVLHMLRGVMGPDAFREGIRKYVAAHRFHNVVSEDLRAAMEAACGQDLKWFFDEWVYGAGYPTYQVAFEYSETRKEGTVRVKQTQADSKYTGLFKMPVDLTFWFADKEEDKARTERVWIAGRDECFTFPMEKRPAWVRFDDGEKVLCKVEFARSLEELSLQLGLDNVTGRTEAAEELGKFGMAAVPVLRDRRKFETSKYVRRAIAGSIVRNLLEVTKKTMGSDGTDSLVEALDDADSKVRVIAAKGFGDYLASLLSSHNHPNLVLEEDKLTGLLLKDPSYFVRAEAARTLGKARARGAFELLRAALGWPSYRNIIREAAVDGLLALEDPRAIPEILNLLEYHMDAGGQHQLVRNSIDALARANVKDKRVISKFEALVQDPYFRTRAAAAAALARLHSTASIPVLVDRWKTERLDETKNAIEQALRDLAKPVEATAAQDLDGKTAEDLRALADKVEAESRDLRLEAEERRLEAEKVRARAERLEPAERPARKEGEGK